eukprot:2332616-Pyramimonas_sp.AAC.1
MSCAPRRPGALFLTFRESAPKCTTHGILGLSSKTGLLEAYVFLHPSLRDDFKYCRCAELVQGRIHSLTLAGLRGTLQISNFRLDPALPLSAQKRQLMVLRRTFLPAQAAA